MGHDSKQRLTEIWRDWGMAHGQELKQRQRAALEHLQTEIDWDSFDTVLRAHQVLLSDPEIPGIGKRPAFEMFWNAVDEHWISPSGARDDVVQLQAMVLAAWPRDDAGGGPLLPLLISPWNIVSGRAMQREHLERWMEECVWPSSISWHSTVRREPQCVVLEEDASWQTARQQLREVAVAMKETTLLLEKCRTDDYFSEVGSHIFQWSKQVSTVVSQVLPGILNAWEEAQPSVPMPSPTRHDAELLWWGQARYCHVLRKPYRYLSDQPDKVLWWAAWEAAERAKRLPSEPAASYLQEVLHALGHDLNESRSLGDWIRSLHTVLADAGDPVSPVAPYLADLVRVDPLGLPVTWIRLDDSDAMDDQDLYDTLGVPMDTPLDRGQWAAWLFRELSLDSRFSDDEAEA